MNVVATCRSWQAAKWTVWLPLCQQLGRVRCPLSDAWRRDLESRGATPALKDLVLRLRSSFSTTTGDVLPSGVNGTRLERADAGAWTPDEDALLQNLVERYGQQWSRISKELNALAKSNKTRTPTICAMRYRRTVDPSILRDPWTPEEDAAILKLYQELGPRWAEIARRLSAVTQNTGDSSTQPLARFRTDKQVLDRFREKLNPERKRVPWTFAEEQRLKALVSELGPSRWAAIAAQLPGRTAKDCQLRWRRCLDPRISRARWTPQEDEKLKAFVSRYGRRWALIAQLMGDRCDIQCLQRWANKLDPNIRRGPWTDLEDRALLEANAAWKRNVFSTEASQQLRFRGHKNIWAWAVRTYPELHGRSPSHCRLRFKALAMSKAVLEGN